jgi:chorismate mutase/prephenate dehydratase
MRIMKNTNYNVSFQGEYGAYSEQAARVYFGRDADTKACRTLRQVFNSVERGATNHGVVPTENSLEGSVTQTYDLLLETPLKVSGEIKFRVNHCLMALPGTRVEDVRVVYSHPQALAQCASFLEKLNVESEPTYDTAGSAKMIKEKQLVNTAAIASERAAELYGLTILCRNIEDSLENLTRFFVIGANDAPPTGKDKTSVIFGTKHTPGALYEVLGELAARKINLTKIESRPIKGKPWEYYFFVDFEGHRQEASCASTLDAIKRRTTYLKLLGSYPQAG